MSTNNVYPTMEQQTRFTSVNEYERSDPILRPCVRRLYSATRGEQNNCHDEDKIEPTSRDGLTWKRFHTTKSKLKSSSTTSHILCGFAMMAATELQVNSPEDNTVPDWLWIMYLICTVLLLTIHSFSLMISSYLLPYIDAASQLNSMQALAESPHEKLRDFVEVAWTISNLGGLFLFQIELILICFVKFWDFSMTAAYAGVSVALPALVLFLCFAYRFYILLLRNKLNTSLDNVQQLDHIKKSMEILHLQ